MFNGRKSHLLYGYYSTCHIHRKSKSACEALSSRPFTISANMLTNVWGRIKPPWPPLSHKPSRSYSSSKEEVVHTQQGQNSLVEVTTLSETINEWVIFQFWSRWHHVAIYRWCYFFEKQWECVQGRLRAGTHDAFGGDEWNSRVGHNGSMLSKNK